MNESCPALDPRVCDRTPVGGAVVRVKADQVEIVSGAASAEKIVRVK